jgi:hypothetical protein
MLLNGCGGDVEAWLSCNRGTRRPLASVWSEPPLFSLHILSKFLTCWLLSFFGARKRWERTVVCLEIGNYLNVCTLSCLFVYYWPVFVVFGWNDSSKLSALLSWSTLQPRKTRLPTKAFLHISCRLLLFGNLVKHVIIPAHTQSRWTIRCFLLLVLHPDATHAQLLYIGRRVFSASCSLNPPPILELLGCS